MEIIFLLSTNASCILLVFVYVCCNCSQGMVLVWKVAINESQSSFIDTITHKSYENNDLWDVAHSTIWVFNLVPHPHTGVVINYTTDEMRHTDSVLAL